MPPVRVVLGGAAVGAGLLILTLGQGLTFFFDEWQYLLHRDFSVTGLLWHHNEHWPTLHVALYMGLAGVFGTGSYLPWQVALVVLHLIIAAGLYRLLERVRLGWFAAGGAVLFLFLGIGGDNLLWGFQIGFDLAIAFGVWALVLVETRPMLAAGLLTAAVATQGPGLVFIVACAVASPRAIRWLWIPVAAYGLWLVTWGAGSVHELRLAEAPLFAVQGITNAAGAMVGQPGALLVVAVVLAIAAGRNRDPLVRAAVFGLLAEYGIIGLVRGNEFLTAARYYYLAAPFLLIAASSVHLGRLDRLVGVAALALALYVNVQHLFVTRDYLGRLQDAEATVPVMLRGSDAGYAAMMAAYKP
jgi:hypothetical protein